MAPKNNHSFPASSADDTLEHGKKIHADGVSPPISTPDQTHVDTCVDLPGPDLEIEADPRAATTPCDTSSSPLAPAAAFRRSSDTDGGLELLFAASLIRQNGESLDQSAAKAISSCSENESAADDASPLDASMEMTETPDVVIEPSDRDVLCGRGGFINKHIGNQVYRKVVDFNKAIYKKVPKRHRILVSRSIVQTIEKHGGRFLQAVNGDGRRSQAWKCIQFRRAVQKTSQALREPSTEVASDIGHNLPDKPPASESQLS